MAQRSSAPERRSGGDEPSEALEFFESPAAFARWLRRHHHKASVLWVGYYKKGADRPSLTWPESVREALRFGWIDGVRQSIDAESYRIRFTPRRTGSNWSRINIGFAEELIAEGRMEPAGRAAYLARSPERSGVYTYEQAGDDAEEIVGREIRRNRAAWADFRARPPWYRRTSARWVMSAKREETRQRRLATLIADCSQGRTIAPLRRKEATSAALSARSGKKK